MYSDSGGSGAPVVLLHGVLMNGTLWKDVVDQLCDRYRCIVLELPFGAHRTPMPDDADLTLESLAKVVAGFLAELDLRDVTLVCNDWGGGQLVVSPGGSDRVANLGLVSCEAFDNYPPGLPGRHCASTRCCREAPSSLRKFFVRAGFAICRSRSAHSRRSASPRIGF